MSAISGKKTAWRKESNMAESVYKVIDLVGTSSESWEKAAAACIDRASQTLRDIRVARVVEQDVHVESGKPLTYRVKLQLSFKYEGGA
jgi:flavin-binding protein dodecin